MRNSSWRHAKHRRNSVIKAKKRFKLERQLGTTDDEHFSLKFSKRSIACKCQLCSYDKYLGRQAKRRRDNAIAEIRERDYQLETEQGPFEVYMSELEDLEAHDQFLSDYYLSTVVLPYSA